MTMTAHSLPRTCRSNHHGFTLIEVLLAMTIASMMIVSILSVFRASLFAREEVKALSEPMTTGPRILDMIEDDLSSLWTFNVLHNRVLKGENRDFVGDEADRLHIIACGRTVNPVRLADDSTGYAPMAEVSYLVKGSNDNTHFLELWRREDPLFDIEWTKGGFYQLLSDRVRAFQIQYFEELGKEAEPFDDWDTAERGHLPRRIKIELEIERPSDSFNKLVEAEDIGPRRLKYTRHIVLPKGWMTILEPGIALVPSVPTEHPTGEQPAAAGAGAGAASARGGPGRSGDSARGGDQRGGGRNTQTSPFPFPGGRGGKTGSNAINDLLKNIGNRGGGRRK
ncbi:MAG: hypothetical protein CMJ85_02715 [Planctomycetes bacterium]|jgi:prepilin-type N-terminal cleavage/methylation domain-containing protein|nr:hypothetical protein [Planctomycetota bacterium]